MNKFKLIIGEHISIIEDEYVTWHDFLHFIDIFRTEGVKCITCNINSINNAFDIINFPTERNLIYLNVSPALIFSHKTSHTIKTNFDSIIHHEVVIGQVFQKYKLKKINYSGSLIFEKI